MKKAIIILGLVLLTLVSLSCITCALGSKPNLLLNNDFESVGQDQNPDNWRADLWQPDSTITVTSKKVHQGKYALEILSDKVSNDARMLQVVKVKPNTYYKLSGWVATENVTPDKIGANLCVLTNTFTNSSYLNNTSDWTLLELNFRTASKQTEVNVGPRLGMWGNDVTGAAYFDDLSLVELDSAPTSFQTLVDPSANPNAKTTTKSSFPIGGLIVIIILVVLIIIFIIFKKRKKGGAVDTVDSEDTTDTVEEGAEDGNEDQQS